MSDDPNDRDPFALARRLRKLEIEHARPANRNDRFRLKGIEAEAIETKRLIEELYSQLRGGWKQGRDFTCEMLRTGRGARNAQRDWMTPSNEGPYFDHLTYWRHGRRPACIVSQPYPGGEGWRDAIVQWASTNGMTVKFPTDFPSWHCFGSTVLVEITKCEN
jgi:hypothetical protein